MNLLYQSAFSEALGWSLIDSLWQMGAIWLFYTLITGNGSRFSAEKRHSLALLGTAAGTMVFFVSLAINFFSAVNEESFFSLAYFIENQAGDIFSGYAITETIIPFISFIYLPAVLFFSLRLIFQVSVNKNVYRKNIVPASNEISSFVSTMSVQMGIIRKVGLWISDKAESPLTIGFWKPIIILPIAVFSHLSCKQVEAVIAHELYHVKRNDYLLNIFVTMAEVVLFFNPFARLMFGIIKKERENSCDDHVLSSGFDAWEYSQALYILGRYRYDRNKLAISATGIGKEFLLQRISRIMNRNNPSPSVLKPFIAFFLCLFVAGFAVRQKQAPVMEDALVMNDIKRVVYYSEVKKIVVPEPVILKEKKKSAPVKTIDPEKIIAPPDLPPPPDAPLPEELLSDENEEMVSTYIASPEVLVFTIIDPAEPQVPDMNCENPPPYVPKSSFYFVEVDTTVGKKIIKL